MLGASQGWPPLLFIAPRAKLAVAPSLGKTRGHRTLTRSHRMLNPQRPVLRRQPRVTSRLNSTVAANGYCTCAPAQHHRTLYCVTLDASDGHWTRAQRALQTRRVTRRTVSVRCSPDPCAERVAKPPAHRKLSTGLTPMRPVHTGTPDTTLDAKGQRPVPPRSASGVPRLLQISHRRNRKYTLIFLKSAEPTPLSTLGTPPSL